MCNNPVTAATYRGGRYARVPNSNGAGYTCIDTTTNQMVADSMCRDSRGNYYPGYYPGYYHMGHYYSRPSWGYDGTVRNGRVMNFSSAPKDGADVKSSNGSVISRGGFGSSGGSSSFSS